jgi:hypothetical protein
MLWFPIDPLPLQSCFVYRSPGFPFSVRHFSWFSLILHAKVWSVVLVRTGPFHILTIRHHITNEVQKEYATAIHCISSIRYTPFYPVSIRSILILSSHLRVGLPRSLSPSDFPTEIVYAFPIFPVVSTCSANNFLLDLIACTFWCT